MKSKKIFKLLSITSLVLFYAVALLSILILFMDAFYIWNPGCCGLPVFEPVFSFIDIQFYQQPELYNDRSFRLLSALSNIVIFSFLLPIFWYMYKLLKNIHADSLFMYENVSIFFKLGFVNLILGSAFNYMDSLLLSKSLTALDITNAELKFSNTFYLDSIASGIVLIIIAAALKSAVHAVEENKKTI